MFEQPQLIFGQQEVAGEPLWKTPTSLPSLANTPELCLDTETTGTNVFKDKPVGISIAYSHGAELIKTYFPFGHSEGNMDPDLIRRWANSELRGKKIICANAKFDNHILKGWGVDLEALGCQLADVQFNAALLDDSPFVKVDLDTLGEKYANMRKLPFGHDMNRMADYPAYYVGPYAERDVEVTHYVNRNTLPLIQKEELTRVLALENSLIYAVCEIERNGCRIDVEKLNQWQSQVRQQYQTLLMELFRSTGMMVEPDSPGSMAKLFNLLKIQPPKPLPKKGRQVEEKEVDTPGKRKYTEDELLSLKHPVIDLVVKARWMTSLLSKFLDKYAAGVDGDILRSQFHQLKTTDAGTISGRFSSSGGGRDNNGFTFNAQQVIGSGLQKRTLGDHHIIRSLFIPNEGMEFASGDLSQIEYRVAAHFANAKHIIDAYNKDPETDYHALAQELIKRYKPEHNNRTVTKNVNFAFTFGSGKRTLAATAGITENEAEVLLGIMKKNAPEYPQLLHRLASQAEKLGFVTTLYGRRARFGTHETRFYKAINSVVQGTAADIFKVYLKALYDERKTLGVTALRQIVHDEANFDKLPGEAYTKRIREFLNTQKVELRVPVLWDLKVGKTWADCH